VRDRDTMEQITLKVEEVIPYIEERIKFWFFFFVNFCHYFCKVLLNVLQKK
jgi:hypothetical protein